MGKNAFRVFVVLSFILFTYTIKAYAAPDISRIQGSDRYSTSIEISRSAWPYGSSEYAVLATGEDFPDALCAAPLAKKLNAPILLVDGYELSSSLSAELYRLGVKYVYIIGGTSAVSSYVEGQISAKGMSCKRIAGADRYETQVEIAKLLGNFEQIVVAEENDFADVLSIAPVAAKRCIPIFLSPEDSLPESISYYLKYKNITKSYIIGGASVISNTVLNQLPGSKRIYGQDRYETNSAVLKEFSPDINFNTTYIATGTNFPDALSGSAAAAITSSPIVLVDKVPGIATKSLISSNIQKINKLKVLGGEGAVSVSTLNELTNINSEDKYNDFSLRYSANFRVKVFDNVYWVPANALGKPKITREQISNLGRGPEELQRNINTVYDVIQYIRVSDFKSADDNINVEEGGLNWEHHKPGTKAIITNEGSYATISNLANYLLKGDYEESGFIQYFQDDGTGYVFNYVKHEGKYYVIDFTHYKNDFRYTAPETGNLSDYKASDFIAGNIHEAASLEDYIKYCIKEYNDPPEIVTVYAADNVLPFAVKKSNDATSICFPSSVKNSVKVIYDIKNDILGLDFIDSPSRYPSWL